MQTLSPLHFNPPNEVGISSAVANQGKCILAEDLLALSLPDETRRNRPTLWSEGATSVAGRLHIYDTFSAQASLCPQSAKHT